MDLTAVSIVKLAAYPILGVFLLAVSCMYTVAVTNGRNRKTTMVLAWLNAANAVLIFLSLVTDLFFL